MLTQTDTHTYIHTHIHKGHAEKIPEGFAMKTSQEAKLSEHILFTKVTI